METGALGIPPQTRAASPGFQQLPDVGVLFKENASLLAIKCGPFQGDPSKGQVFARLPFLHAPGCSFRAGENQPCAFPVPAYE